MAMTTLTTGKVVSEQEKVLRGPQRYGQIDAYIGHGTYGQVQKARDLLDGE